MNGESLILVYYLVLLHKCKEYVTVIKFKTPIFWYMDRLSAAVCHYVHELQPTKMVRFLLPPPLPPG